MTVQEFSDQFDTLVASYRRFKDFDKQEILDSIEFNEYEKSVFLSKAQEDIVKDLYSGRYTGDSFESSEQLRRELEGLVEQQEYTESDEESKKLDDKKYVHTVFTLPDKLLYIVYEQVSWESDTTCLSSILADVYPVKHDEYWRIRNNPFRGPSAKRVLRLDKGESQVELVSNGDIGTYIIRYIRKPEPIVLDEFPEETIDDVNTPQTCKLNQSLHREILDRAVRLALLSKNINTKDNSDNKKGH